MGIIGYDDLAEFIRQNYPKGSRIVEVGVGRHPDVAELLTSDFDIVCTDVADPGTDRIRFVRDDIFCPDLTIYRGASLVYSIRPPIDMQDSIAAVAAKVGADLIIRPFSSEKTDLGRFYGQFRCVNYKKSVFFLYRR